MIMQIYRVYSDSKRLSNLEILDKKRNSILKNDLFPPPPPPITLVRMANLC